MKSLHVTSNREKIAMRISWYSIAVNVFLSLGKFIAGIFGHSAAMVSDAIHSASDVFATFIVMAGIKISGRASDDDHQYGHERLECVASILLSVILALTGLAISNASMYDGTTATAEAVLMAAAQSKKANKVVVSKTIDPKTLQVVRTYAHFHGVELLEASEKDGATDKADVERLLAEGGVAGVVVQQPNRYGVVEDFGGMADACHQQKALFIINSVAADLALLKTPGEWGADVAVGDGQSLGLPMSFGGPYFGYMCCTEKLMRKMPGRIVGMTRDNRGQRAFVLTLQAREQHIRRQKATSNICSNESLMALYATIYLSVMGKEGLKAAAQASYAGAHYMMDRLVATGRFQPAFHQPFFNEFCVRYDGDVDRLLERLLANGILGGVKIDDHTLMIAVTEKRTKEEIDRFVTLTEEDAK